MQYTGRENDNPGNDLGLYCYRARYYMPGIGRFLSEDPLGWASGQLNNYAYVNGNPVGFRDPKGLGGPAAGALTGCEIGAPAGPWGCAAGAVIGAVVVGVAILAVSWWQSRPANDNRRPTANENDHFEGRYNHCLAIYYVDTANCGSWYTNDSVYDACVEHAWANFRLCLNFATRIPFPGYRPR